MRTKAPSQPQMIRVLEKAFEILEAIKRHGSGVGLSDLARYVSMPKPTVYRIIVTLERRGYLDRDLDGGYRVSDKLFSLEQRVPPAQALVRIAPPIMEELANACRETVNLGMLDGGEVVVIATVESPQSVRMTSKVGNRRCLHTTAIGKALLATLPDAAVERLIALKGLPQLTPTTITNQKDLFAELRRIRKQGYAIDNQENELEGRCVGVAIGGVADTGFALSISGPVFRMDLRRLRSLVPILQQHAKRIAEEFRGSSL